MFLEHTKFASLLFIIIHIYCCCAGSTFNTDIGGAVRVRRVALRWSSVVPRSQLVRRSLLLTYSSYRRHYAGVLLSTHWTQETHHHSHPFVFPSVLVPSLLSCGVAQIQSIFPIIMQVHCRQYPQKKTRCHTACIQQAVTTNSRHRIASGFGLRVHARAAPLLHRTAYKVYTTAYVVRGMHLLDLHVAWRYTSYLHTTVGGPI